MTVPRYRRHHSSTYVFVKTLNALCNYFYTNITTFTAQTKTAITTLLCNEMLIPSALKIQLIVLFTIIVVFCFTTNYYSSLTFFAIFPIVIFFF